MTHLVEKLRKRRDPILGADTDCVMAANEIEKLLAENKRVRQMLSIVYGMLACGKEVDVIMDIIITALERQDVDQ